MPSLKTYLEHADELAQDVINAWNASAANLTPDFGTLLHQAFLYKTARQKVENHRTFGILSKRDKAEERAARLIFVRAYKYLLDRQTAGFN